MKQVISRILSRAGLAVTSPKNLASLRSSQEEFFELKSSVFASNVSNYFSIGDVNNALALIRKSTAQLHQDLVALMFLDFKQNGHFVEFGATNGVKFSNSFLLEKLFGWTGILAEPAKIWHKDLRANRNSIIETRCVWRNSGESLEFYETEIGELSTLEIFTGGDLHANARVAGRKYSVQTISLEDLLDENTAPKFIEYLSIDTEGSEYEILRNFNFEKYTFGFISCEHNYTESRELVAELLAGHGYKRVLEHMSLFDDWFVHNSLIKTKGFV